MKKKHLVIVISILILVAVLAIVVYVKFGGMHQGHIVVKAEKDTYKSGEKVKIGSTLVNTGSTDIYFTQDTAGGCRPVYLVTIYNESGGRVWWSGPDICPAVYTPENFRYPAMSSTNLGKVTWDQTDREGNKVPPGTYRIVVTMGHDIVDGERTIKIVE